ncbi:transglycosylase domain-containing protein [Catellatospora sichuanensis]|uniref:transglycosylase domain-containing protein n=1 Tax=Catellatospora sichuanensis TaxID=1969805 RepID=UPI001182E56C|nr:transglycosylase domain-containing protein [Catellatospora sichuanensis]
MTLVELPKSAASPIPPSRRRGLRWLVATAVALVLLAGVAFGLAEYYYTTVPIPRDTSGTQRVRAENLRPGVANTIVAAVDPDFYQPSSEIVWPSSEITKRYAVLAMDAPWDELDSWRVRVAAHKLEGWFTKNQLLDFYLSTAHYGEGVIGLGQAASLYLGKDTRDLSIAEGALLAAHLDAVPGDLQAAWNRVLDTMVERGWLSTTERTGLVFPRTIQR